MKPILIKFNEPTTVKIPFYYVLDDTLNETKELIYVPFWTHIHNWYVKPLVRAFRDGYESFRK